MTNIKTPYRKAVEKRHKAAARYYALLLSKGWPKVMAIDETAARFGYNSRQAIYKIIKPKGNDNEL